MTTEYIYNDMTWAEISDALEYLARYELTEKHYAIKPHNKNKKLSDWYNRKPDPSPDKALRAFAEQLKKGAQ